MILRRARANDATALTELAQQTYRDAFGHSLSAADLAAHLQRNLSRECWLQMIAEDVVLVAEIGESLVGFAQLGDASSATPMARPGDQELHRLYVLAEVQKRGIGTALMDAALAVAHAHGAVRLFLDVWEHNHGARRFYERYGFAVIGERTFTVESGAETSLDLIMMRRMDAADRR